MPSSSNFPGIASPSGQLVAQDIILAAYSFLGIYDTTSPLTPFELQLGLQSLIDLLDQWDNQDLSVFSTTPYVFPFQSGIQTYQVGATNRFVCNVLGNIMTVISGTPGNITAGQVLIAPGIAPNTTITSILSGNQYQISWTAPIPITQVDAGLCSFVSPNTNYFNTISSLDYNWNIPRPVKIDKVEIQYPSGLSQPVKLEIPQVSLEVWAGIPQDNTTSLWPTMVYDDAADGYRNLRFWPIPGNTANCILWVWDQLDKVSSLLDTVFAPPGYAMALKLSLAELLEFHFERSLAPEFHLKALAARNAINNINADIPCIKYESIYGGSQGSSMVFESRGRVRL
jgi:hypothetical protein